MNNKEMVLNMFLELSKEDQSWFSCQIRSDGFNTGETLISRIPGIKKAKADGKGIDFITAKGISLEVKFARKCVSGISSEANTFVWKDLNPTKRQYERAILIGEKEPNKYVIYDLSREEVIRLGYKSTDWMIRVPANPTYLTKKYLTFKELEVSFETLCKRYG